MFNLQVKKKNIFKAKFVLGHIAQVLSGGIKVWVQIDDSDGESILGLFHLSLHCLKSSRPSLASHQLLRRGSQKEN